MVKITRELKHQLRAQLGSYTDASFRAAWSGLSLDEQNAHIARAQAAL